MSSKNHESLMDDVPVKISEKFKPPRKIILPISFQHRLQQDPSCDQYDFTYEQHIIKKIEEWKDIKLLAEKKRKINDESKNVQKEITILKNKLSEIRISQTTLNNLDTEKEINYSSPKNFSPSLPESDFTNNILTPIPISSSHTSVSCNISKLSRFNISDFEPDTSSPFDNMELKTLNDMEELAHVLKTTLPEDPCCSKDLTGPRNGYQQITPLDNFSNQTEPMDMTLQPNMIFSNMEDPINNYNGYNNLEPYLVKPSTCQQDQQKNVSKSVPDIVRELEDELIQSKERSTPPRPSSFGSSSFEDWSPWPAIESPERTSNNFPAKNTNCSIGKTKDNPISIFPNPYEELSIEEKRVVDHAVEMGFPKARAARGCKNFGSDEKRVVEFLLEIQALEEKGFSEDQAEKGYIDNNMNLKETLKHLELKKQFLIYGFPEDKVISALLLFNNDSESTLEHLIT